MKLKELRIQKGLNQKELAKLVGTSSICMCLIENYKCLPIPKDIVGICKVLNCETKDIYEPHEIALQMAKTKGNKENANNTSQLYHLTVNLPKRARKFLKNHLNELGFKNITEWVNYCFEKLEKQFNEQQKKEDFTQASPLKK